MDAVNPLPKMCQSCRVIPGSKHVMSDNGRKKMWKCMACISRKSKVFMLSNKARAR